MEMFTLFGAWIGRLGGEGWTKWTKGRSASYILGKMPADWVAVIVQQLRPCVRARQRTTALGEESALRGHSGWANMSGRIDFSIQAETFFQYEDFYGWSSRTHAWRIVKRKLGASNQRFD